MGYDERLAERLRDLLEGSPNVSERAMFGGLAFLVGGHMAIAASGQGDALVRVDPSDSDGLLDRDGVELAVMRGRPMDGWLRVPLSALRTKRQLAWWTDRATAYARTLPAKSAARPARGT